MPSMSADKICCAAVMSIGRLSVIPLTRLVIISGALAETDEIMFEIKSRNFGTALETLSIMSDIPFLSVSAAFSSPVIRPVSPCITSVKPGSSSYEIEFLTPVKAPFKSVKASS